MKLSLKLESLSSKYEYKVESFHSRSLQSFCVKVHRSIKSIENYRSLCVDVSASERNSSPARYVAWLSTGPAVPAIRCYVEDVSAAGAKLRVYRPPVPNEFTLYFNCKGDAKVRCRVTSRAGPKCDVEFVAASAMYD